MSFRIIGIDKEISAKARQTLKSPQYGHQVFVDVATSYGPCRSCLKTFVTGKEDRLLFTYNAFEGLSNLPLPSPIYIHNDDCEHFDANEFPSGLRELPMLFEGFGDESELITRKPVNSDSIEQTIDDVFNESSIKYINIRNAEAGCFIARIERV